MLIAIFVYRFSFAWRKGHCNQGAQEGLGGFGGKDCGPRRDAQQENHDFHRYGAFALALLRRTHDGVDGLGTLYQGEHQ